MLDYNNNKALWFAVLETNVKEVSGKENELTNEMNKESLYVIFTKVVNEAFWWRLILHTYIQTHWVLE